MAPGDASAQPPSPPGGPDAGAAGAPQTLTGGCLCGAVRYRLDGPLGPVVLCHCAQCRKAQGSAFAANAPVRRETFTLLQGEASLVHYASSAGKWRAFCGRCGSPIHSRRDDKPEWLRLRIGTLDAPPEHVLLAGHIHVASKAPWWPILDDLPQHAATEPGRA